MLRKSAQGDVLAVPVVDNKVAAVQVIRVLQSNLFLAVYPSLFHSSNIPNVADLELDEPVFLVETMDLRVKEGVWWVIGNRDASVSVSVPWYKVWVEPPGEYRRQDIHGQVGEVLSAEEAESMRYQKSFSPAVVEAALRGLHGFGPWRAAFDELAL